MAVAADNMFVCSLAVFGCTLSGYLSCWQRQGFASVYRSQTINKDEGRAEHFPRDLRLCQYQACDAGYASFLVALSKVFSD